VPAKHILIIQQNCLRTVLRSTPFRFSIKHFVSIGKSNK
jgi:hypothetical protein